MRLKSTALVVGAVFLNGVDGFSPAPTGLFGSKPAASTPALRLPVASRLQVALGAVSGLKRVVVTGMGITSCLGNTLEEVKDSLYNAKSGIKKSDKYEEIVMRSGVF